MSWNDVGAPERRTGGGSFVKFEDGKTLTMRVLDDEPHTTYEHKISQMVKKGDKTEEVFRSVPATLRADDSYILANTNRWPADRQHALRVFVYGEGDEAGIKILKGGPGIFKPLKALFDQYGTLTSFDITIRRTGKGKETEYIVSASPMSKQTDVAELRAQVAADQTLQWDNLFPPITGEQQKKILDEAQLDINYDPARTLAEGMTPEQAAAVQFKGGKHKGKTVSEVMVVDSGYVDWAAANFTSDDQIAAACRVAVRLGSLPAATSAPALPSGNPAPAPAASAPTPNPAPAAKAEPAKTSKEQDKLIAQVKAAYEPWDPSMMVEHMKKHGGGTVLKKMTAEQLQAILDNIDE